jgi:hypothetical protein
MEQETFLTKFSFLGKDEALRELYLIYVFCNKVPTYETQRLTNIEYAEPPQVVNIEMLKLDTNKDPIGWPWQHVQLEDRVTFVGDLNNIVMSRDELNFNKDLIRGNFIFDVLQIHGQVYSWECFV